MSIRVVIVDDHPFFRRGLRDTLEQLPDLMVVGEGSDGRTALQIIRETKPDLAIMDVHLPDTTGLEVSRQLLAEFPALKILVFSADASRKLVDEALQLGVVGYLMKANVTDELVRAIRLIMEGRLYLCPDLASQVVSDYKTLLSSLAQQAKPLLNDRDLQVLRSLAEGMQNKEIAAQLRVSTKSVEKVRARLMDKLGCRSVAELTRYAVREGLVPN
jgi:DNA-binding NarL/FixJ family response regulator